MSTITIPASVADAQARLDSVEKLLTAKEWEKAAIVAAFVRLVPAGRPSRNSPPGGYLNAGQFAALGIQGLRKQETVKQYVQRWLDTHDGVYPEPGAKVALPDAPWEGTRTGTDGYDSQAGADRTLDKLVEKHGPGIIAAAIERHPEAASAVATNDMVQAAVHDEIVRDHKEAEREHKERNGKQGPAGGVIGEMRKLMITLGVPSFAWASKKMHEAVVAYQETIPLKPKEIEVLRREIDQGIQHALNTRALLTPVTDEDLAKFMAGQIGEQ